MSARNSPCPCKSGKKFKNCCMPVKADLDGVDVGEGKRRIHLVRAGALAVQRQASKEEPEVAHA